MININEIKQSENIPVSTKKMLIFQPETVIIFDGCEVSNEGMAIIYNRSIKTFSYNIKSNNKTQYKVNQPKGSIFPGKNYLHFTLLGNKNIQNSIVNDMFRISIWSDQTPNKVHIHDYKIAFKINQQNTKNQRFGYQISTALHTSRSRSTSSTASSFKKGTKSTMKNLNIQGITNKIMISEQRRISKLKFVLQKLQKKLIFLQNQQCFLLGKYHTIIQKQEKRVIKLYLIGVIFCFVFGIVIKYLYSQMIHQ